MASMTIADPWAWWITYQDHPVVGPFDGEIEAHEYLQANEHLWEMTDDPYEIVFYNYTPDEALLP